MIDTTEAFLLGLTQGLTEYLPVSSSGHLVIAQSLFGMTEPELFFDIILHMGTLAAIIWYYRSYIVTALKQTVDAAKEIVSGKNGWCGAVDGRPGFYFVTLVTAGTIPTGLMGVLFKDEFESMFGSTAWVGVMLIVTGAVLFSTRFMDNRGRDISQIRVWEAVAIGVAQGLAITPGISRSGATISLALLLGMERETAARFSFLMSIPAIAGAMILHIGSASVDIPLQSIAAGFLTSLVIGYLCLKLLVVFVKDGRLSWFAYYCWPVGAVTLYLSI